MVKASDVVNYLLYKSEPNSPYSLTPLKLQKLLYYIQGWHYGFNNEKLFDEDFCAWEHGPVIPEVYHYYRNYRYLTINSKDYYPNGATPEKFKDVFTPKQLSIIDKIWDNYGKYDGKYLERLTHKEEPWKSTDRNRIIDQNKIKNYFNQFVDDRARI